MYLTRNCRFEPALYDDSARTVLRQIRKAFDTDRPAVISSHRINFSGALFPERREKTLRELGSLLERVRKEYPDVVFATSSEIAESMADRPPATARLAARRLWTMGTNALGIHTGKGELK